MQWYLHITLNSSRNCSICVRVTFDEMESSFPRFNSAVLQQCFLQCFRCLNCFSAAVAKESLLKVPAIVSLANFQIFKFCCDIQGSHLIGYLWVSLFIDQSECLICFFLCTELTLFCTELTLFCTELPENCIYLNQSEVCNFSMYIISHEIVSFLNPANQKRNELLSTSMGFSQW